MLQLTVHNFNDMLGRFTTAELENLLERSPYFQQAHVLLAKKYQLERNLKFDEQLQMAALYTNDRELFYAIFNQANLVRPVKEYVVTEVPPVLDTVLIDTPKTVEEAVAAVQVQDVSAAEHVGEDAVVEEPTVIEEPTVETTAIQDNVVIEEYLDEADAEDQVVEEEPSQQISFTSPHTFDEWLSVFKKGKATVKATAAAPETKAEVGAQPITEPEVAAPINEVKAEELDEELDKMITASVSADYLHQLVQDEKHYSRGLDAFIADQIKRKRKTERPSTAPENDIAPDLVTETLAKLYEGQKRYAKAVKAYEALILKFPEKNDLFAARINYLRKLI